MPTLYHRNSLQQLAQLLVPLLLLFLTVPVVRSTGPEDEAEVKLGRLDKEKMVLRLPGDTQRGSSLITQVCEYDVVDSFALRSYPSVSFDPSASSVTIVGSEVRGPLTIRGPPEKSPLK